MPTPGVNAADLSPAQLTIFYGGRVCVFDSIPAEKVGLSQTSMSSDNFSK